MNNCSLSYIQLHDTKSNIVNCFDITTPLTTPRLIETPSRHQFGAQQTLMTSQKCENAILPLFGCGRSLGEKTKASYNGFYSTVYDLYDIYTSPDICLTPLDMIQTPSDTHRHHPDSRHPPSIDVFTISGHWKKRQYLSIMT